MQIALERDPSSITSAFPTEPAIYNNHTKVNAGFDIGDVQHWDVSDSTLNAGPSLIIAENIPALTKIGSRLFYVYSSSGADRFEQFGCLLDLRMEHHTDSVGVSSWKVPLGLHPIVHHKRPKAHTHQARAYIEENSLISILADRLFSLMADARSDGVEPLTQSLLDFFRFLVANRVNVRPALSMTDAGAIRAVWKNSDKEQVALHFKGEDVVNYVIFHLNDKVMLRDFAQELTNKIPVILTEKDLWRLLRNEG